MKVSATKSAAASMCSVIGGKSVEASGQIGGIGSAVPVTNSALFMLLLAQQNLNDNQKKNVPVSATGEQLEPAMSFFGEITEVQSKKSPNTIALSSEEKSLSSKPVNDELNTDNNHVTDDVQSSTASITESIATMAKSFQMSAAPLSSHNNKVVSEQKSDSQSVQNTEITMKVINPGADKQIGHDSGSIKNIHSLVTPEMKLADTKTDDHLPVDASNLQNAVEMSEGEMIVANSTHPINDHTKNVSGTVNLKSQEKRSSTGTSVHQAESNGVTMVQSESAELPLVQQNSNMAQNQTAQHQSNQNTAHQDTAEESDAKDGAGISVTQGSAELPHSTTVQTSRTTPVVSPEHAEQIIHTVRATAANTGSVETAAKMPDALLDQVVNSVVMQVRDNTSQMKILLQPESLGEVFVKVKVEDDKVNTQIEVSNQTTKAVLEANIGMLRDNLQSRGVDVQHLEIVASNQAGPNMSDGRSETSGHKSKRSFDRDTDKSTEEELHDFGYNTMEFVI